MILLALACREGGKPPTGAATVESTLASCASYAALPEVHGVCLSKQVLSLHSIADVERVCAAAIPWEDECRHEWVADQVRLRREFSPSELLTACGHSSDCAFQILDTQADGDVTSQLTLCERYVPAYLPDCVGHTLYRWAVERHPDDAEARRVIAAAPTYGAAIGSALGRAAVCSRTLECSDEPSVAWDACRTVRDELLADPRRCQATRTGQGANPR